MQGGRVNQIGMSDLHTIWHSMKIILYSNIKVVPKSPMMIMMVMGVVLFSISNVDTSK